MADGLAGIQNILQDMIPGVKVKVLKVVSPGKVDRDMISKVIEQIIEDEDGETDVELESVESDDDVKTESDIEEIEMDAGDATNSTDAEKGEMSVKFVIGGTMQKMPGYMSSKDLVRVPAHLEIKGHSSFLFSIKADNGQQETSGKGYTSPEKAFSRPAQRSADLIIADLARALISREKIPMKVLKDVGELINLTINQDLNHQPLYGRTLFHRIEIPATSDPLSGLYVSAHGMFHSEVLQLRRKFGQWQNDGITFNSTGLEFYEYVEALKLTGDLSVPAGQVAFRAKIGKQYQLPHKGIIPEEFGVIGRYKGQGRLADPGFQNPRWVDGELVILDGKYIRGGPVIGFVYWAPEYHFLVFFNRLRLQS
uniref:Protein EXECUTER 1, chloroplastic n=2 Tax=Anthurium amnicola TaxID=1678845 RepID=A0A1D1YMH3_9ARAE